MPYKKTVKYPSLNFESSKLWQAYIIINDLNLKEKGYLLHYRISLTWNQITKSMLGVRKKI